MTIKELYWIFTDCKRVSTDSRKVQPGDLFISLKGPSFNGNEFAGEALKQGVKYVVIDEGKFKENERFILVEDGLKCLQQLARYHRDQLDIPFIAIAGSNGKTTTKELTREVLKTHFEVYATPGNFNNEIGVPLSILEIGKNTQAVVIEMGARKMGDIDVLCEIAVPTHGLVTNTGKDHLETFKTLENTLKTNAELYRHLEDINGTVFVNIADKDLLNEARGIENKITYGKYEDADVYGKMESLFPFLIISYKDGDEIITIESKLAGKYNFENIMAAVAVGKHFGVPNQLVKKAIENYYPANNRSQIVHQNSNVFILDAYNANPSSMKEALDSFNEVPGFLNKIVVLGDMLELGEASYEEHLLLTIHLKSLGLSKILLVGDEFKKVKDKINCQHFDSIEQAKEWFASQHFENTAFLLKGSRKIAIEKLLN